MKRRTMLLRNGFGMAVLGMVALGAPGTIRSAEPEDLPSMASAERFALIMDGAAVKDAMTGLIWEQSPDSFHGIWSESIAHCLDKTIGGQRGWRLPTKKELAGLTDRTQHDPALPQGHPFSNVKSAIFWSATPSATDDILAWHVSFLSGEVMTDQKSQTRRVWCVMAEFSPR